jgi:DNA-binding NtrC family response regulator
MNRLARHYSLPTRIFSAAALDACQRHSWPGNLRELKEFVKRYLVMGDAELGLGTRDGDSDAAFRDDSELHSGLSHRNVALNPGLREEAVESQPGGAGLKSLVQSVKGEAERHAIASALEQVGWNRKAAARLLLVSYRTLLYKIEQYHMTPPEAPATGYVAGESLRERNLQRG